MENLKDKSFDFVWDSPFNTNSFFLNIGDKVCSELEKYHNEQLKKKKAIIQAINGMGEYYKKIAVLFFYENLSLEEIGIVLDLPEEKVIFWFSNLEEIIKGVKAGYDPDFINQNVIQN